ncbi:RagB/SusD family nutrient uptake outer membrane protein [Flavobacterium sp. NKUCC04_CG]|uniref:RagB/SusD family nutrient uptake outer membrane protein n=1 Tax=Flavobacterium sp. NKUCC04_CG TaxID=2842121 RepID=UPI001C5A979B|nr:RagB/SusD family nutrient uptake outer membrane protein [Flavobacterium sp. NKUCC04_CG]MBW3517723.1 RagB/SusD family nutrient uptake outer membrane protein [Flavobacterium sp. NKUCC04_CG]
MKKIFYTVFSLLVLGGGLVSCSKDALDPSLSVDRDLNVKPIETESDLRAVLTGAYETMTHFTYYGREILMFDEVRTDNAYSVGYSNRFINVSQFAVTANHVYPADTWKQIYKVINSSNLAIGADVTKGDKEAIDNYKGQAYAIRALAHFDLVKLYGQQNVDQNADALGVPYITKFSELDAKSYVRLTVKENRTSIYADIDKAISLMTDDTSEFTRINKQSALGLKSRMALYFAAFFPEDYAVAKDAAAKAMEMGGSIVSKSAFDASFGAESKQANSIFELAQSGVFNQGTNSMFYVFSYDGYGDVLVHPDVLDLFANPDDVRGGEKMIAEDVDGDLRNIGKYPKMSSNLKVMRFEELLLNYAEAAFILNNGDAQALDLINQLRAQRGEVAFTALTLEDIRTERRKELIFEGFRFDDMMRYKMEIPTSPVTTKVIPYGDTKLAFPIPQNEINVTKIKQNKGY